MGLNLFFKSANLNNQYSLDTSPKEVSPMGFFNHGYTVTTPLLNLSPTNTNIGTYPLGQPVTQFPNFNTSPISKTFGDLNLSLYPNTPYPQNLTFDINSPFIKQLKAPSTAKRFGLAITNIDWDSLLSDITKGGDGGLKEVIKNTADGSSDKTDGEGSGGGVKRNSNGNNLETVMNSPGAKITGAALEGINTVLGANKNVMNVSDAAKTVNGVTDSAMSVISAIPGWGQLAGLVYSANKGISKGMKALGLDTDGLTGLDKVLQSDVLALTPTNLINVLSAKRSHDMNIDLEALNNLGNAYMDTAEDIGNAYSKANKKVGGISSLFGGLSKINNEIDRNTIKNDRISNINRNTKIDTYSAQNPMYRLLLNTKLNGLSTMFVKQGGKLYDIEESQRLLHLRELKLNKLEIFKNGGSVNVIPEGALHKNRHHLENIDDKFKEVTTKGIPVVSEGEGGELIQLAEVEKEEIIFRLEVTKKLEELAQKGTDEAAIEAGELLVEEILHNTLDNTNKLI